MFAYPIHECIAFIILTSYMCVCARARACVCVCVCAMRVTTSNTAYNEASDPTAQSIRLWATISESHQSSKKASRDVRVNNYPAFAINRYYVKEQRNVRNVPTEWSARERDGSSGEIKVTRRKQKRVFTSGLPQGCRVLTIDKVSRSDWNIESNASFRIPMNIENVSAKRRTPAVGSRFKENLIPQMINDFPLIVSCRRASFLVFIRPSAFHTRDDVTRNALCHADFVIFLHAKRAVWSMHFHEWKPARLPSYAEDPTSGKSLVTKTAMAIVWQKKEKNLPSWKHRQRDRRFGSALCGQQCRKWGMDRGMIRSDAIDLRNSRAANANANAMPLWSHVRRPQRVLNAVKCHVSRM